ncbi:MAG: hypothetical protein WDN04_03090 [Rhodospirillales bacterium]
MATHWALAWTLALFADISIVADDARLGDTHVKVGLVRGTVARSFGR